MDWRRLVEAERAGEIIARRGDVVTRVLHVEPQSGMVEYHHYDLSTNVVVIESKQDPSIIAAWAQEQAKTDYARDGIKREWMHAARLPQYLIDKWRREGLNIFSKDERDRKEIKNRLNSTEYAHFRTGGQRL